MRPIPYEKIKSKAISAVAGDLALEDNGLLRELGRTGLSPRGAEIADRLAPSARCESVSEIFQRARESIDGWDIRNVADLLSIVPGAIPRGCRPDGMSCSIGRSGEWEISFQPKMERQGPSM